MRNTQITAIFLQYGGDIQALQYGVSSKIIRHFEWQTYFIQQPYEKHTNNRHFSSLWRRYSGLAV
jgi:hypothetical protein